jgi:hypothetical protein
VAPGGGPPTELECACGNGSDDPAGWDLGDFEDRCPECRLADPDGATGSTAAGLFDPETLKVLKLMADGAKEEIGEGEEEE